ncbi:ABC transporter permease [Ethanoligenens harbinense]|uniref:ABC-2 type transporter n=1 Tax=Ethanoligenens harbinense (strain DSM 18485 / JCM 12961 / CGMCC 1.5033 / YUAN-3) TaxID=663278 RepID=E6U8J9_ETHHY|nr:ABC transporter permease [Ethanoligenens harbinense]ADU25990.1 ABC-2 type transporter [Ethanoligenens harbinense YUAN-3]AVQ95138.1 ABC transporter permease [Ethanoligenens harbinense YUAN-3]AYF37829.1 ABC transporter permease [Ethanoligenens harbinense]AYF40551.1 ABC transporter permease [Ethanoligenens harbinense]QCN91384.1 ABC transporter permease [Ethanoligenens harbinense]
MRRFGIIFRIDLFNVFKNPVLVGYNTLFTVALVFTLGYLNGGAYADGWTAYRYYLVSFLVYSVLTGSMTASNAFMERDIKKPNLRILFSPAGSFPIYFSKILASALFDYICHGTLAVALGALFHFPNFGQFWLLLLVLIPLELASAALGTFFCCVLHSEESTSSLLSTVIGVLAFLGGTFFSLDSMGGVVALISRCSPVKWINDALFALLIDGNAAVAAPLFFGALAAAAALTAGCVRFFHTEDYVC